MAPNQLQPQESTIKTSASTISTTGYRASISEGPLQTRDSSFIPDYTVYCVANTSYMKVTRYMYLTAIRTTIMERQRRSQQSIEPEEEGIIHFGANDQINDSAATHPSKISFTKTSPPPPTPVTNRTEPTEKPSAGPDESVLNANAVNNISDSNSKLNTTSNQTNDSLSHNSSESIDSITGNQFKHNSSQLDEKSHLI